MEAMDAVDREDAKGEVVDGEDEGIKAGHWIGLIVLAAAVAAAPLLTARFGPRGFAGAYAFAAAAWLWSRNAPLPFRSSLIIGVILRVILLFAAPALSGDVYRYLWDGKVLASGRDPYALPPNAPQLAPLREPWHVQINHPEIRTIYPPHAEWLFAAAHHLPLWRLLIVAADVAAMFLLRKRALAYATFPPLLFEGAWNGHIEAIAALLLLAAWRTGSGAFAALAGGLKVTPLAAVPLLFVRSRRRLRFATVFLLVLVVPAFPFLGPNFMAGMHDYALRWIFNSPLYDLIFAPLESAHAAEHLKSFFTSIKDPLHLEPVAHFVYFHLYTDFLTRALLGILALAGIAIATRRRSMAGSVGSLLLCSPAIHPWYWLAIAPFASGIWLGLALCAPFSYLLYAGGPKWLVYAICYALPIALTRLSGFATSDAESPPAPTRSRTGRDTSPS